MTGTAGLLLFTCLFLPAIKGCGAPIVPLEMPPFWAPYLYGLVFAIAALARTQLGIAAGAIVLRALAWLVIVGGVALSMLAPPLGVAEVVLGIVLLASIGWAGSSEKRLAITAVVMGCGSALWFGLWALTPDALVGVYLAFASALGLMLGGIAWLADVAFQPSLVVPPAIARHRRP
ncbi:MAG TPA: hypothetical protein VFQ53_14135 [Kofleriaceae bacterium]|nr:hypothetical protein [Kofleriaceae bacterium]